MATTLKARAGTTLVHTVEHRDAAGDLANPGGEGSIARLSIRAVQPQGAVLLLSEEVEDVDGILHQPAPGQWVITLDPDITRILPPTTVWEVDVLNDEGQVFNIDNGVIKTEPKSVFFEVEFPTDDDGGDGGDF